MTETRKPGRDKQPAAKNTRIFPVIAIMGCPQVSRRTRLILAVRLLVNLMPARGPEGISPGLFHTYAPCLFQGFPTHQTSPQTHGLHHTHCDAVQKREREREREREGKKESILRLFQTPDWPAETGTAWYKYLTSRFTHSAHHSLPRHRGGHGQNVPNPQHSCLRP